MLHSVKGSILFEERSNAFDAALKQKKKWKTLEKNYEKDFPRNVGIFLEKIAMHPRTKNAEWIRNETLI